ncbi:hypothetical protein RJ639_043745 [Escallonia herrerae]|uniref:Transcription factor n=1 Tax=Escallonia herrerae TaxID=1293975 RepID=A0AA88WCG8_9ASTE|nr:hypothetical protein RJ639_043745 [Escallonia herrerae]
MQEAYYEEQMGVVIDDMLLQVHMLGGGIIGQAAFTKKHRWMFSDDHSGVSRDMFEDDSEFHHQFASGIKTIAVVPVDLGGVIQFGSTQKILERTGFVHQTKSLFQELENIEGLMLSENAPSCSNRESHGLSGLFAPIISSGNLCPVELKSLDSMRCQDLKETACSSSNRSQSLSFASEQRSLRPTYTNSYHPDNQFHSADSDAQQPLLQSSTLFNCSTETPCSHIWSSADSSASFKGRPSDQECSIGFSAKSRGRESCLDTVQKVQNSTLESLHNTEKLFDLEKASLHTAGNLKSKQHSSMLLHETESELLETPTNLCAFEELFPAFDYNTDLSKSCPVDNFSDWFAPSLDQKNDRVAVTLNNDLLSQAMGLNSANCNFSGGYTAIPVSHPANSVRSSITNVFSSDGKEKCSSISKVENDLFDCLGLDFGGKLARDWDEILMPVVNGGQLDFSADTSECISEQRVGSTFAPRKGLFSKLGIEQLLDGNTGVAKTASGSSFEDQLSSTTKRRRTERTLGSCDQLQLAGLPCFSQKLSSLQPVYNIDRTNNFGPIKEVIPKSEAASWTGENFSVNGESAVSDPKRRVEPVKATKKKAKPGSRPRPKDRQQIHDRMSELRELIPNGEKVREFLTLWNRPCWNTVFCFVRFHVLENMKRVFQ